MYINRREILKIWEIEKTSLEDELLDAIQNWIYADVNFQEKNKTSYLNIPISFDIETSSIIDEISEEKQAFMYVWQMSINGGVILGRYWEEFILLLKLLTLYVDAYTPEEYFRIPIYVHNLGYEFQFFRKLFNWDEVFAIKNRRPIFARSDKIEFRCSYFLSNANLAFVGESMLHRYKLQKLVGDLDYDKTRLPTTELSKTELEYCINDVLIVTSYIQELIEDEGGIKNIPYTSTGFVRNHVRDKCYPTDELGEYTDSALKYKALMKSLTITDVIYQKTKYAFMGGFTHASSLHVREILRNVKSKDIASSYPFTILARQYPMSKFREVGNVYDLDLFRQLIEKFACIFDVTFYNLRPSVVFENILPKHKCFCDGKYTVNNGRVVTAEKLTTTITEIDWESIVKFYTFDEFNINNMYVANKGYLPKQIIESTLDFYEGKTSLKNVKGKEVEYMKSKNKLNSIFGMMVTDIYQQQYIYSSETDEWCNGNVDELSQLSRYNRTHSRFLYYPWGVYVTAYARQRLFDAILELKEDYVYSDTDSVKYFDNNQHEIYFVKCNNKVYIDLMKMCAHYNIDFERCRPSTPTGDKKLIGVWEDDGNYKYFKTLGAKRYMYTDSTGKNLSLTVSGLNKKIAVPYLLKKYGIQGSLKMFDEGLIIPPEATGKLLHTYIDESRGFYAQDYKGDVQLVFSPSSVHLEPEGYFFSIGADYLRFLSGLEFWNK